MQAAVDGGDFIEHAYFGGNIYGTSRRALQVGLLLVIRI